VERWWKFYPTFAAGRLRLEQTRKFIFGYQWVA
jgi:hypothetical protein